MTENGTAESGKYKVYRVQSYWQSGNDGSWSELVGRFATRLEAQLFCMRQSDISGWVSYEVYKDGEMVWQT